MSRRSSTPRSTDSKRAPVPINLNTSEISCENRDVSVSEPTSHIAMPTTRVTISATTWLSVRALTHKPTAR
jgi:hypothetical protein